MGRSERRSGFVQVALICACAALTCWCAWLGYAYNGWPWFWASLAATVSALGWRLNASRALRVGAVAALAGFSSGVIQGADQNLPLIAWEWQHWPMLAAAMWAVGASFSVVKDRYWLETLCATLISCIYIYEYVNDDDSFRALIEALFAVMILLSIGGIIGRLRRYSWSAGDRRADVRDPVQAMEAAQARMRDR